MTLHIFGAAMNTKSNFESSVHVHTSDIEDALALKLLNSEKKSKEKKSGKKKELHNLSAFREELSNLGFLTATSISKIAEYISDGYHLFLLDDKVSFDWEKESYYSWLSFRVKKGIELEDFFAVYEQTKGDLEASIYLTSANNDSDSVKCKNLYRLALMYSISLKDMANMYSEKNLYGATVLSRIKINEVEYDGEKFYSKLSLRKKFNLSEEQVHYLWETLMRFPKGSKRTSVLNRSLERLAAQDYWW